MQRKASGDAPAAAPAEIAARGVAGGGSSLPHLAQIQASFGRHDVAGVTAHRGSPTSEAAHALGARAFVVGNAVGFDGAPDLHTAAHEAAHVVQQRGGVQLKGGLDGGAGDPHEQHADQVADAVVAGRSAEPLLDRMATGASGAPAVQRQPAGELKRAPVSPTENDAATTGERSTSEGTQREPLDAARYWVKYGAQTMQRALNRAMAELVFEITGPGLAFPTSECGPFIHYCLAWQMRDTEPSHVSQLLDTPIDELVDGVRALDNIGCGPDVFEPAVVSRVVERLGLGIRRAVAQLALPYANARSRAVSAAKAAGGDPLRQGPLQSPAGDPAAAQPDPNTLGARSPIEHAAAESMCAGFVAFHPEKFPLVYDTTIPGAPRPAKLALERGRGDWLIVRVCEPAGATAVEVANALYGTPELAHLVVGAGDHFSYVFPPGGQLAEPYESSFRNHMQADGRSVADQVSARNTRDPVIGLDDAHADQRALASAKAAGAATDGAGAAPALQKLEIVQAVVDSIAIAAAPLGVAPIIAPIQARLRHRRAACTADPAEATKWAPQIATQSALVSDARKGFDAITEQMFATGLPARSTADGSELVGDVTASMQAPTRELATAFADVVAASEQIDIGRERLAIAKERLAAYPFDMADRMLAVVRKRIASTSSHATLTMKSYDTERMATLEAELSTTISELRIAVVNGDGTAGLKLTTLRSQLSMLDLQSTIGSTLSAINELSGELRQAESMDHDAAREAWIYDQLRAAVVDWTQFGALYDSFCQAGHGRDPATLDMMRKRLAELRIKTDMPVLVHALALYAEDEGKRQRWINIGIMIGAALLAAASGGVASGAIGGVAGSIVGAGIESLTFTAITGTLNQDPSFGGFMAELALNFATFGGLRAISGGAKFLAGGALTLSQTVKVMTIEGLWMAASAKAQEKIAEALARGGKVTPQSAASIFGQQMAIAFAARVLVRVGGVFVQGITGIDKLHEVQLALARRAEEDQLARQVLASGDGKLGEQLVKVDTDALKAEQHALERVHEVASNPAEAAKHGVTTEPGALDRVTADAKGAEREVREREIAALMAHAEVTADHAIVEPPVYADLLTKHRAQGSTIVEGHDAAGQPRAKITPSLADGSFGKPFTLHQRAGAPTEPEVWMAKLAEGLSPNEKAKLDKMTKGKTPAEQRAMFDRDIEQSREKVRAALRLEQEAAATKAQSKVRVEELRREIVAKGMMNDPEIRAIIDDADMLPRDKIPALRDKLMAKVLRSEAQAAHPNAEVLDNVKLYEKLPEKTIGEWRAKHRGKRAAGITERDDGLYLQRGELDMMLIERNATGSKRRIVAREEIKTGAGDTNADAESQLKAQSDLLKAGAAGTKKLRLEVGGRDVVNEIDLASDAGAQKHTRGPAGKGFDASLGLTASDLETLCKDFLTNDSGPGKTP